MCGDGRNSLTQVWKWAYCMSAGGRVNQLGKNDLVDGIATGAVRLEELDEAVSEQAGAAGLEYGDGPEY